MIPWLLRRSLMELRGFRSCNPARADRALIPSGPFSIRWRATSSSLVASLVGWVLTSVWVIGVVPFCGAAFCFSVMPPPYATTFRELIQA
ncbi:hypothetical protein D3C73_1494480 [compost metagenome]